MTLIRDKLGRGRRLAGRVVGGLWSQEGTLGQLVMRGAFWTMANEWTSNALTFVQTVILVRLLVPADFGIMRVAGFLLAAMAVFTQTGMGTAIIQRKDADPETIDTAWTINLLRNLVLYGAVFLAAPWAARFYENPIICPILRVVGLRLLFNGFQNIGLTLLRKEMDFRAHELFYMVTVAMGVAVTIVAAFILRSVWAIAIGQVGIAGIRTVGSYLFHPYRPRPSLHWHKAKGLLGFGINLTGAGILTFLSTQGDDALVGKVLGLEGLGFYTLAYGLSNLPRYAITRTVSAVVMPAYSKIQDDIERLGRAFLKTVTVVSILIVPACAGLFLLAPDIIEVVYGEPYMPMVACFRVLTLYAMFRGLAACNGPLYIGTGNPRISLYVQIMRFCVLGVLIYPFTRWWGITGTALATAASIAACTVYSFVMVRRLLGQRVVGAWCLGMLRIAAATLFMAVPVHLLRANVGPPGVHFLILEVATGAIVYFVLAWLFVPSVRTESYAALAAIASAGTSNDGRDS